jgi:hypothetical protein
MVCKCVLFHLKIQLFFHILYSVVIVLSDYHH